MWITWANLFTLLRLLCIGPCAWAIVAGHWQAAAAVFALSAASDLVDGPLARRLGHASRLGGLLDHATDAAFVSVSLAALAFTGYVNALLPILVAAAFIQYLLDSKALAGASLKTSWLGRNNGIAYFVLVGIVVIRNALELGFPPDAWIAAGGWVLTLTTLASMLDRTLALRRTRLKP